MLALMISTNLGFSIFLSELRALLSGQGGSDSEPVSLSTGSRSTWRSSTAKGVLAHASHDHSSGSCCYSGAVALKGGSRTARAAFGVPAGLLQ